MLKLSFKTEVKTVHYLWPYNQQTTFDFGKLINCPILGHPPDFYQINLVTFNAYAVCFIAVELSVLFTV